jgi:hypothetical protein
MDNKITYLNTDLDLVSEYDLTALAAALEAGGVCALHTTLCEDGLWRATFEENEHSSDDRPREPERHIAVMLNVIESLAGPLRWTWDNCRLREFNLGYDCGAEPWAFNQGLSADLLGRISAVGASLRITIYPDRE